MKELTAKLLNGNLKKGWSAKDFANYLNISENEFWAQLNKIFGPKPLRDFKARLSQNEKKQKKTFSTNSEVQGVTQDSFTSTTEEIVETEETVKTTIEEKEEAPTPSLKDLEKQESSLQREVCKKEALIQELYSKKFKIVKSLEDEKKSLDDLKIEVEKHKANIILMNTSLNNILGEIDSSNVELTKSRNELNSIREKILEEKKVCIFAFSNGDIEIENNSFNIPDNWTDIFNNMVESEQFDALTVKQIKQLAKIFVLTERFKEKKLKFDIIFDSDQLSSYFNLITA